MRWQLGRNRHHLRHAKQHRGQSEPSLFGEVHMLAISSNHCILYTHLDVVEAVRYSHVVLAANIVGQAVRGEGSDKSHNCQGDGNGITTA